MKKWSVTQNLTFKEQLESGIRYFDLRVSSKPGEVEKEIYFIHGLFGIRVWDGLMEINSFLLQHPGEVIFLDFNHFYAMDDSHHQYLISKILKAFGSKLCPVQPVEKVTLQYLWELKQQVRDIKIWMSLRLVLSMVITIYLCCLKSWALPERGKEPLVKPVNKKHLSTVTPGEST